MPRELRKFSTKKLYHIIFRGIDKQDIFYDNQDRYIFLEYIMEIKKRFKLEVYSYCLMSNHIHMVIKVNDEFFSKSMQSLEIKYSIYFNKKYNRKGHLFENRFVSKTIEDLGYFIRVCRYVHQNPEKAGIDKIQNYKWSSFMEYITNEKIINKKILLHYFNNNVNELIDYTLNINNIEDMRDFAEFEIISRLSDEELCDIIKKIYNLKNVNDIRLMKSEDKEKTVKGLKLIKGTSYSQISRVTNLNRKYIAKI